MTNVFGLVCRTVLKVKKQQVRIWKRFFRKLKILTASDFSQGPVNPCLIGVREEEKESRQSSTKQKEETQPPCQTWKFLCLLETDVIPSSLVTLVGMI